MEKRLLWSISFLGESIFHDVIKLSHLPTATNFTGVEIPTEEHWLPHVKNAPDSLVATLQFFRFSCCLFITALLWLIRSHKSTRDPNSGIIPGPRWYIPYIGSLTFVCRRWFDTLAELRQRHGDVYRLRVGNLDVIVLNGLETVRRALVGDGTEEGRHRSRVFAGRPDLHTFQLASRGKSMSFNSYSPDWCRHRRLAERAMKTMNNKEEFWNTAVAGEVRKFVDAFVEVPPGVEYDPCEDILWSVARVKYAMCYGGVDAEEGTSETGEDFRAMITNTLNLIDCHSRGNVVDFFPWARRLFARQERALNKVCADMLAVTERKHAEHVRTYSPRSVRDLQDALIRHGIYGDCALRDVDQVAMTVQEYIGAGLDIVHAALMWTILYVTKYPHVQRRVQAEVEAVVGRTRQPLAADAPLLPYTEAVVLEVLRHASVVPLALPHSATEDTHLNGIPIPQGVFLMVNLHSINHDSSIYEQPYSFNPERFLGRSETGEVVVRRDRCYQFGMGKRRCIGEEFSRVELVMYLSGLLQRCTLGQGLRRGEGYSLEPRLGVVLKPKSFSVVVHPR